MTVLSFLGWRWTSEVEQLQGYAPELAAWVIVVAILNLPALQVSPYARFAPDTAALVAAALALPPEATGAVTFVGTLDTLELKRRINPLKTLFNRSQMALSSFLGSLAVQSFGTRFQTSSLIFGLGLLALAVISLSNMIIVSVAMTLERGLTFRSAIQRLRLGTLADYVLTFVAWAVLGSLVAVVYRTMHPWALLAFLAPAVLGRQTLLRSHMLVDTHRAYRSREQSLRELNYRAYRERLDERKLIAADLHDEVLQPLFKVTLMAHVLKADLASGRLLEIEQDLPELVTAAEVASSTLRGLIGDLRESKLGRGGLPNALIRLAQDLQRTGAPPISVEVRDVPLDPIEALTFYQVAKEALSNAATHSRGERILLTLQHEEGEVRLTVTDDGIGFDPEIEPEGHFGLQIMRERAASIGASLYIDSKPRSGCTVTLCLRPGKDSRTP